VIPSLEVLDKKTKHTPDDHALTTQLGQGAQLLGIGLIDHIIIAGGQFMSFRQRGLLPESVTAPDRYPPSSSDA